MRKGVKGNYKEKARFLNHESKVLDENGFLTNEAKIEIELKIDQFNRFLAENPTKKQIIIDYFTKCKDTPNYLYSIIDVTSTLRNVNSGINGINGDYIKILTNIIVKKLSTKSFFYTYGPNQDCIHLALILLFYPLKVEYIPARHANAITTELELKRLREECEKIDKIQALSSERIDELSERYKKTEQQLNEYEEMMARKFHIDLSKTTGDTQPDVLDSSKKVPVNIELDVTDDTEWDKDFELDPTENLARMVKNHDKFKMNHQPNENCSTIRNFKEKTNCINYEKTLTLMKSNIKEFCMQNHLEQPFKTTRKGGKRSNRKTKKMKKTYKKSTRKNKNKK